MSRWFFIIAFLFFSPLPSLAGGGDGGGDGGHASQYGTTGPVGSASYGQSVGLGSVADTANSVSNSGTFGLVSYDPFNTKVDKEFNARLSTDENGVTTEVDAPDAKGSRPGGMFGNPTGSPLGTTFSNDPNSPPGPGLSASQPFSPDPSTPSTSGGSPSAGLSGEGGQDSIGAGNPGDDGLGEGTSGGDGRSSPGSAPGAGPSGGGDTASSDDSPSPGPSDGPSSGGNGDNTSNPDNSATPGSNNFLMNLFCRRTDLNEAQKQTCRQQGYLKDSVRSTAAIPGVNAVKALLTPPLEAFGSVMGYGFGLMSVRSQNGSEPQDRYVNFDSVVTRTSDNSSISLNQRPTPTSTMETFPDNSLVNTTTSSSTSTPAVSVSVSASSTANLTNTISLEVKATNLQGVTLLNWSTVEKMTVGSDVDLYFRWRADEYSQCLPFFNDDGRYALLTSGVDRTFVTGNTEAEGYDIEERSGIYRIECGRQANGESGVDLRTVEVTVQ